MNRVEVSLLDCWAKGRIFGAIICMIPPINLADWTPRRGSALSRERKGIKLRVDLRPLPKLCSGCPLPKFHVVMEPRRVFKTLAMLHNAKLVSDQLWDHILEV